MVISCEKETLLEDELGLMKTEIKQFIQGKSDEIDQKLERVDIIEQKVDQVLKMLQKLTETKKEQ